MFPEDLQDTIEMSLFNYRVGVKEIVPDTLEEALQDGEMQEEINSLLFDRGDVEEIFERYEHEYDLTLYWREVYELDRILIEKRKIIIEANPDYFDWRERNCEPRSHWWWYLDELTSEELQAIRRRAGLAPEALHVSPESTIESPVAVREQGEQYGEDEEVT